MSEICNDLILAQSMPSGAVHTIIAEIQTGTLPAIRRKPDPLLRPAPRSPVSASTVARFEAGEELKERTVDALRIALEKAGVEFLDDDGQGVRLKPLRKKKGK